MSPGLSLLKKIGIMEVDKAPSAQPPFLLLGLAYNFWWILLFFPHSPEMQLWGHLPRYTSHKNQHPLGGSALPQWRCFHVPEKEGEVRRVLLTLDCPEYFKSNLRVLDFIWKYKGSSCILTYVWVCFSFFPHCHPPPILNVLWQFLSTVPTLGSALLSPSHTANLN